MLESINSVRRRYNGDHAARARGVREMRRGMAARFPTSGIDVTFARASTITYSYSCRYCTRSHNNNLYLYKCNML